jgi:hypothetical protein
MSGDLINLNKARKAKERAAHKAQADVNAVKFGRTKAERILEARRKTKADTTLSAMKFEDD